MSVVVGVTHKAVRGWASYKLPLPGANHPARLYFLGNVSAVKVVQDVFERGNIHLLPVHTIHTVSDRNVADVVSREENLNIAASFDVVPAQAREVFRDDAFDLPSLNVSNHPLK